MQSSLIRTRWAAVGAAVAISLGAGGISISQATTSSGEMPIYVPIDPCRLTDTRPAFQVGPRTAPLGPAETYTLSGWGTVGDCTLPGSTTGLSLNMTAVGATLPTFLTLFPADSNLPNASHLNPMPDQPATPNAVNVDLDTSGEFSIYNLQGDVHVIIDVVGYYDHHTHDGLYYTEAEVDGAIEAAIAAAAESSTLFATVDSSGNLVYGRGVVSVTVTGTSFTFVKFDRTIEGQCAAVAQIGTTSGLETSTGHIDVSFKYPDTVGLDIENNNGVNAQLPFHLVVHC